MRPIDRALFLLCVGAATYGYSARIASLCREPPPLAVQAVLVTAAICAAAICAAAVLVGEECEERRR